MPFAPRGCFTALVTPFTEDGTDVDWAAYERLVEAQVAAGVAGVVPCGTTGEAPTLTDAEQRALIERTVRVSRGRTAVLAGTSANDTRKAVATCRAAFDVGADAAMVVMPYYNRPSQEGLFRHVQAVAAAVPFPIVLYNIPARTGVDLHLDTLGHVLDGCPNVVAVKDATNNVHFCQGAARFGDRLAILSGDDALTVPLMTAGATGVVSVTSNLYPTEVCRVVGDALAGDWAPARARHQRLLPVHAALFSEPNPAPIKAALAARGLMTSAVRLPLVAATEEASQRVAAAMRTFEGR
jgi:4-hydroxy-tetrahydrodipicolinate synthase